MVNRRPTPSELAALKLEIAQRYKRQANKAAGQRNRSRGMAAIRLAELTRWLDDTFGQGVELEPNAQGELIVRIFAHHFGALRDAPRRFTSWILIYAPWLGLRSRERLIREATEHPIKWSADKLAWKIRLTDEQRTRLKVRTIGAIDCSKEQREARRKAKRAERDAARYQRKRSSQIPPSI
jgi:hypothetical protein